MRPLPEYIPPTPAMVGVQLQLTSRRCALGLAAIAATGMLWSGYAIYLSSARVLTDVVTWVGPLFGVTAAGILSILIISADVLTTAVELELGARLRPASVITAALIAVAVFLVVEPRGVHGTWFEAFFYALPALLSGVAALMSRFLSLSIRTAISKLDARPAAGQTSTVGRGS